MDDHAVLVEKLRRYFEHSGTDPDFAHEIYHDDAVLEFPQSGERFEGVANFKEWRARYPADVQYRIRRTTAREDFVVVELSLRYDGGPWQYGVQLTEFRDGKVELERVYVTEGWEAPEWRAPWRSDTPADPPE
ncbi:MAG TPA: nuclear transport factor 2 family protein [Jiangellales bacterium]|nr:nuclear transport factor 2 family protein [Jiangellales bacterium]